MTQSFEFAAAHRLHCADMSEARNYEIFGKCNNPNGHGHNYQLEVTVAGRPDPATGHVIPLRQMEEIVNERVINRFDHKHLNQDCPEFRTLNPSVENITRVIWGLLEGQFGAARLARVRVWETAKTYAEYEGSEK
ncbi:MAG: 6-carboxytetrahydropterin synthase [Phycisphaerae bacterium]|nr:6-carboxytetrahydropterin synthase [Phycisphaerae bacterium]